MGTIAVPFSYIGISIYRRRTAADPRWTGERDGRGLRTILRGGERAGEKTLDCAVRAFIIPILFTVSPWTRSPVKLTALQANLRQ